jgi:hypothetical protein
MEEQRLGFMKQMTTRFAKLTRRTQVISIVAVLAVGYWMWPSEPECPYTSDDPELNAMYEDACAEWGDRLDDEPESTYDGGLLANGLIPDGPWTVCVLADLDMSKPWNQDAAASAANAGRVVAAQDNVSCGSGQTLVTLMVQGGQAVGTIPR